MLVSMKKYGLGWDGVGLRQCDEGGDDAEGGEELHCSCDVVISYLRNWGGQVPIESCSICYLCF